MTEGSSSQTTPVLVLGAGFTALSVLRAFGRKGIPAYVMIDKGDDCAIRFSRWFKSIPLSRTKFLTLPAFLDAGVLKRAVVIPCSDLWVEVTSLLPRRLTAFPFDGRWQPSGLPRQRASSANVNQTRLTSSRNDSAENRERLW